MTIEIKVEGSGSFDARLNAFKQRLGNKVQRGIMEATKTLLAESLPLVPRDTEALFNDGHMRQEGSGLETSGVVGYGTYGFAAIGYSVKEDKLVVRVPSEYAVIVHQDFVNTKTHDPGTGPGYLSGPIETKQTELRQAFNIGFNLNG